MAQTELHFLKGRSENGYVTFGIPWKRGEVTDNGFKAEDETGAIPISSRPIAYWSDGSYKWTSHTVKAQGNVKVSTGTSVEVSGNTATEDDNAITVNNGIIEAVFPKSGNVLMKTPYADAVIKAVKELRSSEDGCPVTKQITYLGEIENVKLEETGAMKTVVRVDGVYKNEKFGSFLRYITYFTVYNNEREINIKLTFIYDGDAKKDFIKGIGIDFIQKMTGELYNRHIKLAGDYGVMHEAAQMMSLWRPRLGLPIYKKQMIGEAIDFEGVTDLRNGNPVDMKDIDNVTKWDFYRLQQVTSDSFVVTKRTAPEECTFIKVGFGGRSKGLLYAGSTDRGIAVALKDFYQKAPSSIYAKGLSQDECTVTAWIIPPDAEAMDMRHYDTVAHDQTYYEGFPWVGSDAYGIATTNEATLYMFDGVPSDDDIMAKADRMQNPPVLVCTPEYYHELKVMGEWSLPSRETPLKAWLEDELDKVFDFYKNEIEQRRWYGIFDYGDVMHTYDSQRHCWKYDMGGYAWQNTELVPTLWLWYEFLRTGREDVFTVAEAMSRHAADVDVYHIGELKGLGSRHNVVHWGDSCKEPRIAMAGHHRALYFLTGGDYRMRDVFDDVKDADFATLNMDPLRFFYKKEEMKLPTHARSGPDWSTYCSNWYTQWELNADTKYRDKIQTGIDDLKQAPMRMISGSNYEYDPESGHLGYIGESASGGSHLAVCMGGPETWIELVGLLDDEVFKDMLLQYGSFYFLPAEEKQRISNGLINGNGFVYPYMATALASYAARELKDEKLAYQVWQVLVHSLAGANKDEGFDEEVVSYYNNPQLREMFWISTNFAAQWSLNTIIAMEYTKDYMKQSKDEYEFEPWTKS